MKGWLRALIGLVAIGVLAFVIADYFLRRDCVDAGGVWDRRAFTCYGAGAIGPALDSPDQT